MAGIDRTRDRDVCTDLNWGESKTREVGIERAEKN
jgi:hypothetical protein